jgi:iron transport multicopper oxidase
VHYLDPGLAPIPGTEEKLIGVNGAYAWNTVLEAVEGDTLEVLVVNELDEPTSIHWHGLHQRGSNYFDGAAGVTQCGVPPGKNFTYTLQLDRAGTFWWHSHYHVQYAKGLKGALVVKDSDDPYPNVLLQLSDWYLSTELWREPAPRAVLVNGLLRPTTRLEANTTYRIRLANTGVLAPLNFSIDDHNLTVIEADATLVRPVVVTRLQLAVGQRYSVLVTVKPGDHWLRAYWAFGLTQDHASLLMSGFGTSSGRAPSSYVDLNEADLRPLYGSPPMPSVFLEFRLQHRVLPNGTEQSKVSVNGDVFAPYLSPTEPTLLTASKNAMLPASSRVVPLENASVVQLTVWNNDTGEHPFHLHGHSFWIVERGRGLLTAPPTRPLQQAVLRDTVSLNACERASHGVCEEESVEYVVLRFLADNPGAWLFHCHVDQHLLSGLAITFLVDQKSLFMPPDVAGLCMHPKADSANLVEAPPATSGSPGGPLMLPMVLALIPTVVMSVAGVLFHIRAISMRPLVVCSVERLAAGLVLGAISTELAPLIELGSLRSVLTGFFSGVLVAFAVKLLGERMSAERAPTFPDKAIYSHLESRAVRGIPWGMVFATAIDALGDGLLLGLTTVGGGLRAGATVAFALTVEMGLLGLSVAERVRRGGVSRRTGVAIALALPLLILVGALFGASAAGLASAGLMAFGSSVLLYLVVEELLEPCDSVVARAQLFVGYAIVLALDHL